MIIRIVVAALMLVLGLGVSEAATVRDAYAALARHDEVAAARIVVPLAQSGDARAQTLLGFLCATGRGVPQNFVEAAYWYRNASEQGDPTGQYMLGLMYDKGHGVPQDYVLAYKWLNLAVAGANGRTRQDWVRIRDAVANKLSLAERTTAQALALEWQLQRGR
jgi:TPR repeat protein